VTGRKLQTCETAAQADCFALDARQVFLCAGTVTQCNDLHEGMNADKPACKEMLPRRSAAPDVVPLQEPEAVRSRAGRGRRFPMAVRARHVHTNLIARDWRTLSGFCREVFGCVSVPPERHYRGLDLERGTGVAGSELHGEHLLLPKWGEGGPTREIYSYTWLCPARGPRSTARASRTSRSRFPMSRPRVRRSSQPEASL